jgi:hypothetical protein
MRATVFACFILLQTLSNDATAQSISASGTAEETPAFSYSLVPSFQMNANTTVSKTREIYNLLIGGQLRGDASHHIGRMNFTWMLDLSLAQKVNSDRLPERTRDDLIFSFIPSMRLYEERTLRLFLEVTMHTQMTKSIVDDEYVKRFMDPAFFYQTLYLGHLYEWKSDDKTASFTFRHGAGYALQQTSYSRFVLTSDRIADGLTSQNPLIEVQRRGGLKLESGVSYLAGINYRNTLAPDLVFRLDAFTVLLSKSGFIGDPLDSRAYSSFNPTFNYKYFSSGYRLVVSYDKNYSKRRKLIQELTVGIRLDFHN